MVGAAAAGFEMVVGTRGVDVPGRPPRTAPPAPGSRANPPPPAPGAGPRRDSAEPSAGGGTVSTDGTSAFVRRVARLQANATTTPHVKACRAMISAALPGPRRARIRALG